LQAEIEAPATAGGGTTLELKDKIVIIFTCVLAAGNTITATVAGSIVVPCCGTAFVGFLIADGTATNIGIEAIRIRLASRW
jgi:hypothetical protein